MLVFIHFLLLLCWRSTFGVNFIVFGCAVASNSDGPNQIQEEINEQHEAKKEQIQVIALDVFGPILEDEEIGQEGSLSKAEQYTFQDRMLELSFPSGNDGVDDEHNHNAVQVDIHMIVVVQAEQSSGGHEPQVIKKFDPLSPDRGFLSLDAFIAYQLDKWEEEAECSDGCGLYQLGTVEGALVQSQINGSCQAQGRQTHLKNPLKAKQTGQNSTFLLPPHRCRPIKMANRNRSPTSTHPKESWKPSVQTMSPVVQKLRKLQLKPAKLMPRCVEKLVVYMVRPKIYDICMKSSPRKQCLKRNMTGTTRLSETMEQTLPGVSQSGMTLFIVVLFCCQAINYYFMRRVSLEYFQPIIVVFLEEESK